MTNNEIKKSLYRQKPTAYKLNEDVDNIYYSASIENGTQAGCKLKFIIPLEEGKGFNNEEPAHLLIRWMAS